MKRPTRRRKKPPTPQELATASPFDPVPVKEPRRKRKKEASAQQPVVADEPGSAPAPTPVPAPAPAKQKGKRLGGLGRALGAPLRLLGKPLRLLGKPFRKLGKLRGKARIVVYGLVAIVAVLVVITLRGGRDDEKLVRQALANYEQASRTKDYQRLCDKLLAKSYVRQTASSGLPCEVALRTALADVHNPTLEVLSVEVSGDRAAARVRGSAQGQVPGEANYTLIREDGGWKILPPSSGSASATP